MGYMSGKSMAEQVEEGNIGLRQALTWHLQGNHYPPLPVALVDVAEKAIILADMPEHGIELPEGITFRGGKTVITAAEAIESMHLECFLED